jgi:hypothetical protein
MYIYCFAAAPLDEANQEQKVIFVFLDHYLHTSGSTWWLTLIKILIFFDLRALFELSRALTGGGTFILGIFFLMDCYFYFCYQGPVRNR